MIVDLYHMASEVILAIVHLEAHKTLVRLIPMNCSLMSGQVLGQCEGFITLRALQSSKPSWCYSPSSSLQKKQNTLYIMKVFIIVLSWLGRHIFKLIEKIILQ